LLLTVLVEERNGLVVGFMTNKINEKFANVLTEEQRKLIQLYACSNREELVKELLVLKERALESHANMMDDEFFKKGLSMAVDGVEAHEIEETLEILIEETAEYYHGAAHYWLLAGESCPVIGLIGAVLGLILALQKLDNPAEMAAGIAGAFTATVTGIAGAYIFMGPWGNKLKAKSHDFIKEKHVILAGILGISHGDNPRTLEMKLLNYLSPLEDKKSQFDKA
jgi:chemotaxis protein MotA